MPQPDGSIADGRLRKGAQRRQELLDATLRLIAKAGLAAVSQRAVAAEAGLPPSAVFYYFAGVDELVLATLTAVNDRCIADLETVPAGSDGIATLAAMITDYARADLLAEYDLYLLACRDDRLRAETARWDAALAATSARITPDPVAADGLVAAINGLYLRSAAAGPLDAAAVTAMLRHIAGV